jgi:Flp pilus assembly protein TadG
MRSLRMHSVNANRSLCGFRSIVFRSCWSRRIADETGGTLLEFAITTSLLLMIIFGVLDCSRALYFEHYVSYSAEEAARYAMVRGSTWGGATCSTTITESCTATTANVTSFVQSITPMGNSSELTVATTWTGKTPAGSTCTNQNGNNSPGCVVQVKVSYSFNFVLPFLPKNTLLLTSTSAVGISQ